MTGDSTLVVEKEISGVMKYCNMCTRSIGLSLVDKPRKFLENLTKNLLATLCVLALTTMLCGETFYLLGLITTSKSAFKEIVAALHIYVYSFLGYSKLVTLWLKRRIYKKLMIELVEIWPTDGNEEEDSIKSSSIAALRRLQFWYMIVNVLGLVFYCTTPLAVTFYQRKRGFPTEPAFIWFVAYPFDKRDAVFHKIAYVYEIFAGYTTVGSMLSSEIMFTMMASNISMLLRILQSKIRKLAISPEHTYSRQSIASLSRTREGIYNEIVTIIKVHQKLISYSIDLESAFSLLNLSNVVFSSIMVCCCVFNIMLLDPWMELSNKFFLGAVLTQIGIMCWYADDIYRSSLGVADAAYECAWFAAGPRCRRALLLIILRSQKPLCFTAYKFSDIKLTTYSSIMTTSYSYFALLYSMFQSNDSP